MTLYETLNPHLRKIDKELDESDKDKSDIDESDKAESFRGQCLNMLSKAACLKHCVPPKIWQQGAAIKFRDA